ncbi:hypothetical protein B5807_02725 [Epicoccum nigrum]|uniref:C3H1-type domain-containing protein n=1 Tax=Epicoccum nigrum TaxID=105696 RepID=A0A1Y2MA64_EPING|nr:hypothetical protein B5807_02725 [Epicoccum nigrum]
MVLPEEDAEVFKRWVLPKLETISDADAEVLADYVVALVTTKDTDANIRRNCLESLSDFLQDNTAAFVDEVIRTLESKSYVRTSTEAQAQAQAQAPAPIPSIVGTSTSEYLPNPARALNTAPPHAPTGPAATRTSQHRLPDRPPTEGTQTQQERGSRKRKQNDRDTSRSQATGNDRPVKQATRRGAKNGRGGLNAAAPAFAPPPSIPPYNPAFGEIPPFDPTNPMALMAMMAAFGQALPGMGMPPLPAFDPEASNTRCADYDTKGFCAIGSMCPYQHGLDYEPVVPFEPKQGGARHRNGRQGRGRAPFSLPGPTHDRTNTTLVVEQIPEENYSEDDVRDFFGKFGTILDVRLQPYKRLAIVKYDTHDAAAAAYNSPKVIFENRFVKVYWHRSEHDSPSGAASEAGDGYGGDAETLDPEEIARRQEEAQRAFEERKRKAEEADARAAELDARLQETNAEILRVKRELARAASGDEDFSQDLASLQAEAESLFAQQDAVAAESSAWSAGAGAGRGAYSGGYRGRGGYAPRGRGGRGAFRGRGGVASRVKRLDNRPRRIAIKDVVPGSERDEALRQHLFTVPDIVDTAQHPEEPSTLIVSFGERYQAEAFIDASLPLSKADPAIGPLEMEWVANDALGGIPSETSNKDTGTGSAATGGGGEGDEEMGDAAKAEHDGEADADSVRVKDEDGDLDVAEDEDRWL